MFELNIIDADEVIKEELEDDSSLVLTKDITVTDLESSSSENLCSIISVPVDIDESTSENKKIKEEDKNIILVPGEPEDLHCKSETQDTALCSNDGCKDQRESFSGLLEEKEKENESKLKKRKRDKKSDNGSLNLDKKSGKKSKHKKYEKPSDQVLKRYQCTLCPRVFQRPSSFKAHQRKHSLNGRPFSCQDCKNTFLYRCQLRDHVRTHTGERPYKCHSCSKSFARKGCLVSHMITHSDSLPFQCDICCKRFARKYNLAKHVQSHSGERPYGCLNCSRRFKCKQSLDKHHRVHELNIYSCAICEQSFDTKRRLTHHKINEHVSYRPFTCQICHKPFIFKSQLTYHIKEHNLERPYSCGKCKKSYFKKGHLLSHIKQYCSDYESEPQIKLEVV